jgi:hypothetical protein
MPDWPRMLSFSLCVIWSRLLAGFCVAPEQPTSRIASDKVERRVRVLMACGVRVGEQPIQWPSPDLSAIPGCRPIR